MKPSPKPAGWKGGDYIPGRYFSALKYNASRRGIDFDVTVDYLDRVWQEQQGKCAYSNRELVMPSKKDPGNASLDRIDSNIGYVESNVQFVHKTINSIKWNLDEDEFFAWIEQIYNHILKDNP